MSTYCECGQQAAICFIRIVDQIVKKTYKCESCFTLDNSPLLVSDPLKTHSQKDTLITCANCNTSWQKVLTLQKMGCPQCYQSFKNTLILYLKENEALSPNFFSSDFSSSLHLGHSPYSNQTITPILQLITLKETLKEMLKTEEYEQAAILRDQIQQLKNQGFCDE